MNNLAITFFYCTLHKPVQKISTKGDDEYHPTLSISFFRFQFLWNTTIVWVFHSFFVRLSFQVSSTFASYRNIFSFDISYRPTYFLNDWWVKTVRARVVRTWYLRQSSFSASILIYGPGLHLVVSAIHEGQRLISSSSLGNPNSRSISSVTAPPNHPGLVGLFRKESMLCRIKKTPIGSYIGFETKFCDTPNYFHFRFRDLCERASVI